MTRAAALVLSSLILLGCGRGQLPAPVVYGDSGTVDTPASRVEVPKPPRKPVIRTRPASLTSRTARTAVSGQPRGRAGIHTVERGDTVYEISRRYHVPIRAIIAANGLAPPYHLRIGQRLRIPVPRRHVVRRGDTLYEISRAYGVDLHRLARLNRLAPPFTIRPRQVLVVPWASPRPEGSRIASRQDARKGTGEPVSRQSRGAGTGAGATAPASAGGTAGPVASARPANATAAMPKAIPQPPPRSSGRFLWPLRGPVLAGFGPQPDGLHNDGINLAAAAGTPVRAAENGVVAYVGNELRGFGNLLLVKHADGWITAYAHTRRIAVDRGQKVRRGQVIAHVGSSGGVTRPQLHFEIRHGSRAVDPLTMLGQQEAARRL